MMNLKKWFKSLVTTEKKRPQVYCAPVGYVLKKDAVDGIISTSSSTYIEAEVKNVDTSAWNHNDKLYLDANNPGGLTNVHPNKSNKKIALLLALSVIVIALAMVIWSHF